MLRSPPCCFASQARQSSTALRNRAHGTPQTSPRVFHCSSLRLGRPLQLLSTCSSSHVTTSSQRGAHFRQFCQMKGPALRSSGSTLMPSCSSRIRLAI